MSTHILDKSFNFVSIARHDILASRPNLDKNTIIVFVDIYPSLAELCGHPQPTDVDGVSYAPSMKKVIDSHRSILARQLSKESRIIN